MARTQILVHIWGPEQRFRRCFADGLNQSLVSSAVQATGSEAFSLNFNITWSYQRNLYSGLLQVRKNGQQKTCNLSCNIAAKRVEKRCWAFYHSSIKPVLQQISLLQVAWILTSNWIKLRGSHAAHGSYVTGCKTSLLWTGKAHNMYRFCCKK